MLATVNADLWTMGIPVLEKAIRTFAVYGGLLVLLRFGGKRDLAQLNSFDLVVLLLLSNVVQNAVIGSDNSLAGGLIGAGILVVVNAGVVRVFRRNEASVRFFEGAPTVLVDAGRILQRNVRRLGLRRSDVEVALRRQGADEVDQVAKASLEPGGLLVVELFDDQQDATRADIHRLEEKLDRLLAMAGPSSSDR
jgi:uncharacterized membrane protein YcaP (DUF421 family)